MKWWIASWAITLLTISTPRSKKLCQSDVHEWACGRCDFEKRAYIFFFHCWKHAVPLVLPVLVTLVFLVFLIRCLVLPRFSLALRALRILLKCWLLLTKCKEYRTIAEYSKQYPRNMKQFVQETGCALVKNSHVACQSFRSTVSIASKNGPNMCLVLRKPSAISSLVRIAGTIGRKHAQSFHLPN